MAFRKASVSLRTSLTKLLSSAVPTDRPHFLSVSVGCAAEWIVVVLLPTRIDLIADVFLNPHGFVECVVPQSRRQSFDAKQCQQGGICVSLFFQWIGRPEFVESAVDFGPRAEFARLDAGNQIHDVGEWN